MGWAEEASRVEILLDWAQQCLPAAGGLCPCLADSQKWLSHLDAIE